MRRSRIIQNEKEKQSENEIFPKPKIPNFRRGFGCLMVTLLDFNKTTNKELHVGLLFGEVSP
jgi:hypothetical protein